MRIKWQLNKFITCTIKMIKNKIKEKLIKCEKNKFQKSKSINRLASSIVHFTQRVVSIKNRGASTALHMKLIEMFSTNLT